MATEGECALWRRGNGEGPIGTATHGAGLTDGLKHRVEGPKARAPIVGDEVLPNDAVPVGGLCYTGKAQVVDPQVVYMLERAVFRAQMHAK